jgi:hypothetical protein
MWLLLRMMAQNWPGLDSVLGAQIKAKAKAKAKAKVTMVAVAWIWALKWIMDLLK